MPRRQDRILTGLPNCSPFARASPNTHPPPSCRPRSGNGSSSRTGVITPSCQLPTCSVRSNVPWHTATGSCVQLISSATDQGNISRTSTSMATGGRAGRTLSVSAMSVSVQRHGPQRRRPRAGLMSWPFGYFRLYACGRPDGSAVKNPSVLIVSRRRSGDLARVRRRHLRRLPRPCVGRPRLGLYDDYAVYGPRPLPSRRQRDSRLPRSHPPTVPRPHHDGAVQTTIGVIMRTIPKVCHLAVRSGRYLPDLPKSRVNVTGRGYCYGVVMKTRPVRRPPSGCLCAGVCGAGSPCVRGCGGSDTRLSARLPGDRPGVLP